MATSASWPRTTPAQRVSYPRSRCAGCDRRLAPADEAFEGQFPILTPNRVLLITCWLCAECLAQPKLRDPLGMRRQALTLLDRLWRWYTATSG